MGRKFLADDFESYLNEIEEFGRVNYPDLYNSFKVGDQGQFLFDVLAHLSSSNSFKLNKKVLSIFLEDTKSKTVGSKYARMFNYVPDNGSGSNVDMILTLQTPYAFPISILPNSEATGPDSTVFHYDAATPLVIGAGETSKVVKFTQGRLLEKFFVSNGGKNQSYPLLGLEDGEFIAIASVIVKVEGVEWTCYDFLPFESVNAFSVDLFADVPKVKFGNGIIGNVPAQNANIEISFRVHKGIGSRVGDNVITAFDTPLIVKGETINYLFSHEKSAGGFDPEQLDSVKVNAPRFHESQDRAVTTKDYNTLAVKKESLVQAHTESPRSIKDDVILNAYIDSLETQLTGSSIEEQGLETLGQLKDYLEGVISDTCKANTVMVYTLSVDENNRYLAPTQSVMDELQLDLQSKADAVHTVKVVSGEDNLVQVDMTVLAGFGTNADAVERMKEIEDSLLKSTDDRESGGTGYGLLIRREAGDHLFLDKVYESTKAALTKTQNLVSINITIDGPAELLDEKGNLILDGTKKIITPNIVTIKQIFNETTRI